MLSSFINRKIIYTVEYFALDERNREKEIFMLVAECGMLIATKRPAAVRLSMNAEERNA